VHELEFAGQVEERDGLQFTEAFVADAVGFHHLHGGVLADHHALLVGGVQNLDGENGVVDRFGVAFHLGHDGADVDFSQNDALLVDGRPLLLELQHQHHLLERYLLHRLVLQTHRYVVLGQDLFFQEVQVVEDFEFDESLDAAEQNLSSVEVAVCHFRNDVFVDVDRKLLHEHDQTQELLVFLLFLLEVDAVDHRVGLVFNHELEFNQIGFGFPHPPQHRTFGDWQHHEPQRLCFGGNEFALLEHLLLLRDTHAFGYLLRILEGVVVPDVHMMVVVTLLFFAHAVVVELLIVQFISGVFQHV